MEIVALTFLIDAIVLTIFIRAVSDRLPLSFFVYLIVLILIYLTSLDWIFRPLTIIIISILYIIYLIYMEED
jgi:hypothetical protein